MHFLYLKFLFFFIFFVALFGFTLYVRYRDKHSEQLQTRDHAVASNEDSQVVSSIFFLKIIALINDIPWYS